MKRVKRESPNHAGRAVRPIEPKRLSAIRGGGPLGISVDVLGLTPQLMMGQHNEALVQTRGSL